MTSLRHTPPPRSVLAVAAHPDDIEFMAGGTLVSWIEQGTQVHYLLVTDGCGGSRDPNQTAEALASRRRREQRAAAEILGVASVTFFGYRDATVEASLELRLAIARVIRQVRPEAVVTFDPQRYYHSAGINHPDHLAVGVSTLGAVMPLANTLLAAPTLAAEGLAPHDVQSVYLFDPAAPTAWMPLAQRDVQRKLAALEAHASQLIGWDAAAAAYGAMRQAAQLARASGVRCNLAEAFTLVQLHAPVVAANAHWNMEHRTPASVQAGIAWLAHATRQAMARLNLAVKPR
jgi:LmbE family N-acetylglucosaminyl deacetylase